MENNILQKVREDISAYLDSYKLDKYYKMYGFGYADGDEFERMLLLTEADVNFILEHRQEDNDPVFHVKLCETIIPFQDKINKLVEPTFRLEEAWGIDLSNFSFPLTFTISEIDAPCSLPKNTEQQIIITKEELERILFATAKFWLGGDRQSAYMVLYECLSKYVFGIYMPYVIFCESIDSILASIIGPYKIQELVYTNGDTKDLEYDDCYRWWCDGGVFFNTTLTLIGNKLELLLESTSMESNKERIISVNFTELMIKLGYCDRYDTFNKLTVMLKQGNNIADESLIKLLKANDISYQDALNTYRVSSY